MYHYNFSKCSRTSLKTFQSVKWKNVWEQLTMFWIIARNIRKKSFEHFKMFSEEFVWKHFWLFHWNISKCSLTFKKFPNKFVNISKCLSEKCLRITPNVLDNCQKCSSGKSFEYFKIFLNNLFGNILDCSLRTFLNVSEEFVWKHFRMFHWTELHSLLWTHVRKNPIPMSIFEDWAGKSSRLMKSP